MNCQDAQHYIYDYLDRDLSASAHAEMDVHLSGCDICREAINEEQSLRALLTGLPVEPASEGFIERALQIAQEVAAPSQVIHSQHRRGFILGFSSAAVAGLVLWLVVGLLPIENKVEQDGLQHVQIVLHETHNLKLAFYSKQARIGATISIDLPTNVELVGFPDKRNLVWAANLTEGDNVLTLPIKALAINSGELVAKIEYGKQAKTLKVRLQTTKPNMTQLNNALVLFS